MDAGATASAAPVDGTRPGLVPTDATLVRRRRLDRALNGILLGVGLEFFLGMWLNLFGAFSNGYPSIVNSSANPTGLVLVAHTVVGVLLFVGGLGILSIALRDPTPSLRWLTVTGWVGTLIAGLAGSAFVSSGYSDAYASFAMAVGFAVAVTGYYEGLAVLRGLLGAAGAPSPRPS